MKTLIRFLAALAPMALTLPALGQQVPAHLPTPESIEAYLKYQQRPGYSAFAVSRQGHYGASWSYGVVSAAEQAAIEDCEKDQPQDPCFVISVDGEILYDAIDISALLTRFEDSKAAIWPEVARNQVPIQIAKNDELIKAYHAYLDDKGFKAFAAGRDGSFAAVSGKLNEIQARFSALEKCGNHSAGGRQCELIDVNHQALGGRVKITLPEEVPIDLTDAPTLQSDTRSKTLARPYFKDRWQEYLDASRNKAVAVNNFGAIGFAVEHATTMVAEEAALSSCEAYNQLRRTTGLPGAKLAPCYIIAVNNFFDADAIKLVEQQQ